MPLPTFIIAGERRCGTTSLYHAMLAHPDVWLHPRRELGYFVEQELREWSGRDLEALPEGEWERTHSQEGYAACFDGAGDAIAIGEKSADYLFWRPGHARMAAIVPDAKLVLTLRDPVDRAWSHYWNEVQKERETLPFEAALAAEPERAASRPYQRYHLSYRARADWDVSIGSLLDHFPAEQVLVVTLEERIAAPEETLRRINAFVGVDPEKGLGNAKGHYNRNAALTPRGWATVPPVSWLERAWSRGTHSLLWRTMKDPERVEKWRRRLAKPFRKPATKVPLPDELRRRLWDDFEGPVGRLEALLGREFPEWREKNRA
jgi:hypothetical protein